MIAKGLNRDEIPARRGNHWSSGTVIDILRNEKYKDEAFEKIVESIIVNLVEKNITVIPARKNEKSSIA